jgi:hypothetical protein
MCLIFTLLSYCLYCISFLLHNSLNTILRWNIFCKGFVWKEKVSEIEGLCIYECGLYFHTVCFIQLYFLQHTSLVAAPTLSIITFMFSVTVFVHLTCVTYCSCENESYAWCLPSKCLCRFKRLAKVYVWLSYLLLRHNIFLLRLVFILQLPIVT